VAVDILGDDPVVIVGIRRRVLVEIVIRGLLVGFIKLVFVGIVRRMMGNIFALPGIIWRATPIAPWRMGSLEDGIIQTHVRHVCVQRVCWVVVEAQVAEVFLHLW